MLKTQGGKRKTDPGYGQGNVSIEWDTDVLLDESEVTERLLKVFNAPGYRPPTLPSVAMELMSLSQKPDVELDEIVDLLEQDAMLAGKVMKLLQSPIYMPVQTITSLGGAVTRLGLNTLRDVVLEISLNMRVFRSDSFSKTMELTRRHCTATAYLARMISRYTSMEGEYAFLCGLLHDIGIAGVIIALSEGIPKQKRPDLISIWPAIDRAHAEAGSLMTRLWELPPEIQLVVGAHHQVMIEGFPHPLAATVCLADDLARELGYGPVAREGEDAGGATELENACLQSHTGIDASSEGTLAHAREALGLSDSQLELILADAEKLEGQLG